MIALALLEGYVVARGAQRLELSHALDSAVDFSRGCTRKHTTLVTSHCAIAGGFVAGAFYRALVDHDATSFCSTLLRAAGLFLVCTLLQATTRWLSELISLR